MTQIKLPIQRNKKKTQIELPTQRNKNRHKLNYQYNKVKNIELQIQRIERI